MNAIFTYNFVNKTIVGTQSAINRANKGIEPEYSMLTSMLNAQPNFIVAVKQIKKNQDKKTFHGLSIQRMKDYITTLDDSDRKIAEFNAILKVAEAKGAKYPLAKKWFLKTYPEFKTNEIEASETAKKKAEEELNAMANAEQMLELIENEDLDEAC